MMDKMSKIESEKSAQRRTAGDAVKKPRVLVIDGVTVQEEYRQGGPSLWECLLEAMGTK